MPNALAAYDPSGIQFDLVGPTVDDDIRRAITRYGADAVKASIKHQTKVKRGRKPEKDWPELRHVLNADAIEWLAGGDPFSSRSNYSIAKDFAEKNPGHNFAATMQRIERKLRKNRREWALSSAQRMSYEDYPHEAHIRTLRALSEISDHWIWADVLERAEADLADYEAKHGAPPPTTLSMKEVEVVARSVLNAPGSLSELVQSQKLFSNIR